MVAIICYCILFISSNSNCNCSSNELWSSSFNTVHGICNLSYNWYCCKRIRSPSCFSSCWNGMFLSLMKLQVLYSSFFRFTGVHASSPTLLQSSSLLPLSPGITLTMKNTGVRHFNWRMIYDLNFFEFSISEQPFVVYYIIWCMYFFFFKNLLKFIHFFLVQHVNFLSLFRFLILTFFWIIYIKKFLLCTVLFFCIYK